MPPESPYAHAPRLPEGDCIDPARLFGSSDHGDAVGEVERVELEVGPGRGWFLVERLEAAPHVHLLGFEIRRKWATIVDDRLRERGQGMRARVFAEDAKQALPRLLPASLSVVYVHFPDPWWKKRHHKRLVITPEVLGEIARVLRPQGTLLIQTDVEERALAYERLVAECSHFAPVEGAPRVADHPYGARSPRERRAIEDGLPVYRLHYQRGPLIR